MTVCIATIHTDDEGNHSLITSSDRRISLYGGHFSQDGAAVKFSSIHPEWIVMFAGDASEAVPLLDAVAANMKRLKTNTRNAVVKTCRIAYMRERKRMIETQILPDYDIEDYSEFAGLNKTEPEQSLYKNISNVISHAEENWSLLFAGFDDKKNPHLFIISERGKVTYCNVQQFAAIGSGALAASIYLATYPYNRRLEIGEAVFAACSAKFFARAASDVGEDTLVTLMRPAARIGQVLREDQIKSIRDGWKELPKIPPKLRDRLTNDVINTFTVLSLHGNVHPAPSGKIIED